MHFRPPILQLRLRKQRRIRQYVYTEPQEVHILVCTSFCYALASAVLLCRAGAEHLHCPAHTIPRPGAGPGEPALGDRLGSHSSHHRSRGDDVEMGSHSPGRALLVATHASLLAGHAAVSTSGMGPTLSLPLGLYRHHSPLLHKSTAGLGSSARVRIADWSDRRSSLKQAAPQQVSREGPALCHATAGLNAVCRCRIVAAVGSRGRHQGLGLVGQVVCGGGWFSYIWPWLDSTGRQVRV